MSDEMVWNCEQLSSDLSSERNKNAALRAENAALLKRAEKAEAACAEMRRDYEEYAYDYHESRRLNGDIAHTGMFCDCADPTCKQARTWLENNPGQRILALLDKMESALLSIRDNGLDARQCQLAAKNALDK